MSSLLDNTISIPIQKSKNTYKIKIAIDIVCFQISNIIKNADICYIWENFFSTLPNNKDNFHYEIIILQRSNINNDTYKFKTDLNLETKFKVKTIPEFNYMCMNQDVDILNNICKINKYDVFISSSFTYCTIIPNIVIVYDIIPDIFKNPINYQINHQFIQKNKAILNGSAFITFSKKTYNDLLECYPHINKNEFPLDIIKHNLVKKSINEEQQNLQLLTEYLSTLENYILKPKQFINIILQSYPEINPDRSRELIYCIRKNLENPYVKMVYDFGSGLDLFANSNVPNDVSSNVPIDNTHRNSIKYKQITNSKWLTFEMAINFANTNNIRGDNEYWCILNLDIFLDDKTQWDTIRGQLNNGFIYAQSRHEFNILETITNEPKIISNMDTNFAQLFHAHTQDAWLFKTPIKCNDNKEINFDFELGFLGCDNAIADRFVKLGYKVINQPITYKIFHYDIAKGKNSSNYLEKHIKETNDKTTKMIKPKNKYPERSGSYLVPNYDQMLSMNNKNEIDLIQLLNRLGGCSNFERYEFISKLFSDRILINNP
jgi:hypothetical protein